MRVAFRTLGCKVNRVESEQIAAELLGKGVEVVAEENAQVIVVNTCTVTGEADAKARKAVRHALKAPSHPVVVVTGCLASIDAAALSALGDRVVVEADKSAVSTRVAAALGLESPAVGLSAMPLASTLPGAFRTRSPLKIQDGCDAFCAYCIVPHARGNPRSVLLAECVSRTEACIEAGTREIVLTGINLGRYHDPKTGADLAALVEALSATGIERIRLSSIEPVHLTDGLLDVLAAHGCVCEHLHVPLQSGSDDVLGRMGRSYTVAQFEERVAAARELIPGLALTTDVIVGLPGETPADAAATLSACEQLGFSKLHVFRYSKRAGTPAAEMPDQVPVDERAQRASALRDMGSALRESYLRSRLGHTAEVLVERVAEGKATGTTRDYVQVSFSAGDEVRVGDLAAVELLTLDGEVVTGDLSAGWRR